MYIKRDLEDKIKKYLKVREILAIVGPRQSGKTTLLKEIFKTVKKESVYIDFEDRDVLNLFNNDIKSFYSLYIKNRNYLFIDEFQYAKDGGQKLKYLYDTYKIKIIISGSSVLDLTHQALKYLVGRIFVFHLYPFSFDEYLRYKAPSIYDRIYFSLHKKISNYLFKNGKNFPVITQPLIKEINTYYQEYAIFGGYPRVVIADNREEKITVLKNIYNTYFLREIRDILQLSTEDELQKLIKALSLQTGSLVAYNELGQISLLNYNNLIKHLNILEKTFVIKRILPFCKNRRVEIAKSPKIYFVDNGFRNVVMDNFSLLGDRVDRGSINENFIASEMLKREVSLNYWRTKSNAEVDFIIEKENKNIALEVKSTLVGGRSTKGLLSFKSKYPSAQAIIVSENYSYFDRQKNIIFLPIFFI